MSLALVGFGLVAARRERLGRRVVLRRRHLAAGLGGGLLVVAAFLADAPNVASGGMPGDFPAPLFLIGLGLAVAAAVDALRQGGNDARERVRFTTAA